MLVHIVEQKDYNAVFDHFISNHREGEPFMNRMLLLLSVGNNYPQSRKCASLIQSSNTGATGMSARNAEKTLPVI